MAGGLLDRKRFFVSQNFQPTHRTPRLPTENHAYAAPSATGDLVPTTIERRDVGAHDVLIEIRFAGICHSDIHTVRGDWGPQQYPLAPGHEIAGIVTEVRSAVTRHAVGDRVVWAAWSTPAANVPTASRARSSTASTE
jgi:D-arabinose 1-dehydrogenase-like Zn-dependent alcohol dehydrogenase